MEKWEWNYLRASIVCIVSGMFTGVALIPYLSVKAGLIGIIVGVIVFVIALRIPEE